MTDTTRIVLLGKTGSGKSSLANTIFGEHVFTVGDSPNSETRECQTVTRIVRGRRICLIDPPGIFDTDPNSRRKSEVILQCMQACDPGPHAFLLVLRVERYTAQEAAVVNIILQYLSEKALKYTTVVFTRGYDLPEDLKIENWVSQNPKLSELVQRCGNRCHVFDNTHWNNTHNYQYRNNQYQVDSLLNTIDRMVQQNGGRYYTSVNMQILRRGRFREAPEGVQLAVFFGVNNMGALIESDIPWDKVMVLVAEAALAVGRGTVWVCKTIRNKTVMQAIRFLAGLYNLFAKYINQNEMVPSVSWSCTVL